MADTPIPPPFDAYTGTEPYIFVSYSHKDASSVFPDLVALRERGYRIWYDEGIDPGNEWPEAVGRALASCSFFIVYLTPNAVSSRNVRNEINFAIDQDTPLLAIHLVETALPPGLKLQIGSNQAILKYRTDKSNYRKLLDRAVPASVKDPALDRSLRLKPEPMVAGDSSAIEGSTSDGAPVQARVTNLWRLSEQVKLARTLSLDDTESTVANIPINEVAALLPDPVPEGTKSATGAAAPRATSNKAPGSRPVNRAPRPTGAGTDNLARFSLQELASEPPVFPNPGPPRRADEGLTGRRKLTRRYKELIDRLLFAAASILLVNMLPLLDVAALSAANQLKVGRPLPLDLAVVAIAVSVNGALCTLAILYIPRLMTWLYKLMVIGTGTRTKARTHNSDDMVDGDQFAEVFVAVLISIWQVAYGLETWFGVWAQPGGQSVWQIVAYRGTYRLLSGHMSGVVQESGYWLWMAGVIVIATAVGLQRHLGRWSDRFFY